MRILALLVLLLAAPLAARAETNACTTIDSIPITISTPGSYCLHSDLTSSVVSAANMIFIAQTNDVTLDCNGHYLKGVNYTQDIEAVDYYGIKVGSSSRVVVRNCNVHGFRNGIIVHRFADGYDRSRDVVLENNNVERAGYGIYVSSEGSSRISGNRIVSASRRGIEVYAAPGQTTVSGNQILRTGDGSNTAEAGVFSQLGGWLIVENNVFALTMVPAGASAAAAVRLDTFSGTGFQFNNNRVLDTTSGDLDIDVAIANPGAYTCLGNIIVGYGAALPANCPGPSNVAY